MTSARAPRTMRAPGGGKRRLAVYAEAAASTALSSWPARRGSAIRRETASSGVVVVRVRSAAVALASIMTSISAHRRSELRGAERFSIGTRHVKNKKAFGMTEAKIGFAWAFAFRAGRPPFEQVAKHHDQCLKTEEQVCCASLATLAACDETIILNLSTENDSCVRMTLEVLT